MRNRLTERIGDGVRYDNGKYIVTCYPKNNNLTPIDKLAVKLCDLEDKIEYGAVIISPCKVGDKTFLLLEKVVGGYNIVESKCVKVTDNGYSRIYSMYFDCREIGNTLEFHLDDFGKTVFLTREEAEAKLQEGKG